MRLTWFSDLPLRLNMSITGTVVILCVLVFRLLFRKAPNRIVCALWLIVVFRLLCPIAPTSDVSLLGAFEKVHSAQTVERTQEAAQKPIVQTGEMPNAAPIVSEQIPDFTPQTDSFSAAGVDAAEDMQKQTAREVDWLLIIWASGASLMLGCSVFSLLRLRRKLIGAVKLRDNIYLADHIETPFVLGILRPRIMLPSALSRQEQEYIILHEKTHIRRFDHMRKLLHFAALCIHWFNPFVWLSFVLAGQDMEMACDEQVLGILGTQIRADYSESLLRLATGHRIFAGAPLAFGEGNPKNRIRHVLNWKKPALWIIVSALIVAGSAAIVLGTNPVSPENPIGGAYQAAELLYEAPDYREERVLQEMPIYALDEDGVLYEQNNTEDQIWSRIGETEQISLSTAELCAMYSPGSVKVYARMAGVRTAWRVLADGQKFYLLMQTNREVLMAVGYGEGETSRIRWLFRLDGMGKYLPLQEMIEQKAQVKNVKLFASYTADVWQWMVLYGFQYDGGMGVAAFGYDETGMPTKLLDCEAFSGSDIYCMTAARRQYSDCSYTVVLSENEALSRVTAKYGDYIVERDSSSCPDMHIIFWWQEELSDDENFHPEMHYYDAEGNELEPTSTAQQTASHNSAAQQMQQKPETEREDFYELFWELDQASFDAYLEKNPDVLANGWSGIHINEAGFEEKGIDAYTVYGEQVLGLDAKNGVLLIRVAGSDWRGVLGIGKNPALLNIEVADTLGVYGQSVGEIAENHAGILAMNASAFRDEDERGNLGSGNGGILAGYARSNGIDYGMHMTSYGDKRLELHENNLMYIRNVGDPVSDDCTDCCEFAPAMVVDSQQIVDYGYSGTHPRACIGQSDRLEILMLVIEGRQTQSLGTDVNTCTEIMMRHRCMQAMNLDGGSSAMLWFDGKDCISSSSKPLRDLGGRPLPNAWVYHSTDWSDKTDASAANGKE
ncbi:MAG: phosphodiester glycosidase family protein [Clostridia bacterium]|nr:phosphodiester glycosidase family protein [Clostridia bacterium]